ncbi:MAG: hypothetical protein ACOYNO_14330 [Saprospiraceae bacterium]
MKHITTLAWALVWAHWGLHAQQIEIDAHRLPVDVPLNYLFSGCLQYGPTGYYLLYEDFGEHTGAYLGHLTPEMSVKRGGMVLEKRDTLSNLLFRKTFIRDDPGFKTLAVRYFQGHIVWYYEKTNIRSGNTVFFIDLIDDKGRITSETAIGLQMPTGPNIHFQQTLSDISGDSTKYMVLTTYTDSTRLINGKPAWQGFLTVLDENRRLLKTEMVRIEANVENGSALKAMVANNGDVYLLAHEEEPNGNEALRAYCLPVQGAQSTFSLLPEAATFHAADLLETANGQLVCAAIGSDRETGQQTAFVAYLDAAGAPWKVHKMDIRADSVFQANQKKRPLASYRKTCLASKVFYLPLDSGAAAYVWETNSTNVSPKNTVEQAVDLSNVYFGDVYVAFVHPDGLLDTVIILPKHQMPSQTVQGLSCFAMPYYGQVLLFYNTLTKQQLADADGTAYFSAYDTELVTMTTVDRHEPLRHTVISDRNLKNTAFLPSRCLSLQDNRFLLVAYTKRVDNKTNPLEGLLEPVLLLNGVVTLH